MVEPQEDGILKLIMADYMKFASKSMEKMKELPNEYLAASQRRFDGFRQLKWGIDEDLAQAMAYLDKVRVKIRENTLSAENPEGLLTGNCDSYIKCLEINSIKLSGLFQLDEQRWVKSIEMAKQEASRVSDQLNQLINDNQRRLAGLIKKSKSHEIGLSSDLKEDEVVDWCAKQEKVDVPNRGDSVLVAMKKLQEAKANLEERKGHAINNDDIGRKQKEPDQNQDDAPCQVFWIVKNEFKSQSHDSYSNALNHLTTLRYPAILMHGKEEKDTVNINSKKQRREAYRLRTHIAQLLNDVDIEWYDDEDDDY